MERTGLTSTSKSSTLATFLGLSVAGFVLFSQEHAFSQALSFGASNRESMASRQKRAYLIYLESAHWRKLRREAFIRDGFQCVSCGSNQNLRGHHIRYRKDLFKCTVDDIETRCEDCHTALHAGKKRSRKLKRKAQKSWIRLLSIPMPVFELAFRDTEQ
jgi:Restriction endonuclease